MNSCATGCPAETCSQRTAVPDDKPSRVDSALACVAKCRAHDGAATALFYAKGVCTPVLPTGQTAHRHDVVCVCVHCVCTVCARCVHGVCVSCAIADASVNPGLCSCRTEACAHDTVRFPHTAETNMGEEGGEYGHSASQAVIGTPS